MTIRPTAGPPFSDLSDDELIETGAALELRLSELEAALGVVAAEVGTELRTT